MIHAFALEPEVVASWGRRDAYRFIYDKFGLGTPRVLLELPAFKKWKREVYDSANALGLSAEDMKRIEELFRLLGEYKCRRTDSMYDGLLDWLTNAEREYDRKPFGAILAARNPRAHPAVLVDGFDLSDPRWAAQTGTIIERTPESLATALTAMLVNARSVHLVDQHFGPENKRHRVVLETLLTVLAKNGVMPEKICFYCSVKAPLAAFEDSAAGMARYLPAGITVEFVRLRERNGGERLHNRYILTDLGGVRFGDGLDAGGAWQSDDLSLMTPDQYRLRWEQYVVDNGAFERVDYPAPVRGTRTTAR